MRSVNHLTQGKKFLPHDGAPRTSALPFKGAASKQGLADLLVAEFVAPESGEVFLCVGDAIQVFPFLGAFARYYRNKSGIAQVQVQRVPLPPPPAKRTMQRQQAASELEPNQP
jgi:hypothetical protein